MFTKKVTKRECVKVLPETFINALEKVLCTANITDGHVQKPGFNFLLLVIKHTDKQK